MFLQKLKKNQLTKDRLKDIKAGLSPDCEEGFFRCGSSGPGHGSVCLPHGCECQIWDI